jgi:hypothetical protein
MPGPVAWIIKRDIAARRVHRAVTFNLFRNRSKSLPCGRVSMSSAFLLAEAPNTFSDQVLGAWSFDAHCGHFGTVISGGTGYFKGSRLLDL